MLNDPRTTTAERQARARAIARAGGLEEALSSGALPKHINTTVSEALVLGLLRQGVEKFVTVFGHGSTEIGEALRVYESEGLVRTFGVRNEIEAAHAAAALRWATGEKAAVVTSIGPGALQAFAASLVAASDGLGVWFLFGDETTEDEGPNMQQIPGTSQYAFLKTFSNMGPAYALSTPGALATALRRGHNAVDHPHRGGPFFLLLPMNIQPHTLNDFNVEELPHGAPPPLGAAADNGAYAWAARAVREARKVVVKAGGGARNAGPELLEFLDLADAVSVTSPVVSGVVPFDHPRNMTVGGAKGTLSGNYAMENADLLVAVGTRFVCQSDCSRTGYPGVKHVVNINTEAGAAMHYGKTTALIGDAAATLARLNEELRAERKTGGPIGGAQTESEWFRTCREQRKRWDDFRQERYAKETLHDEMWGRDVLTQPAAIKAATDWARANDAVSFFDAGDVQANGFQIVEDDRPGRTFTDTGASYMGFAVSALLATALTSKPFYGLALTGDGSFTMNPQILIDGTFHGARGCILLLDNRRMAAISSLQHAQYSAEHATRDHVPVDYVQWAGAVTGVKALHGGYSAASLVAALDQARAHQGISLIHVPVYFGDDPLGGMGVFGRWNVGNWVRDTQALRHRIGL